MDLLTIDTPALIIEESKMNANIERMRNRAKSLGVTLRPHLKTSKCWEVAKRQLWTPHGPKLPFSDFPTFAGKSLNGSFGRHMVRQPYRL